MAILVDSSRFGAAVYDRDSNVVETVEVNSLQLPRRPLFKLLLILSASFDSKLPPPRMQRGQRSPPEHALVPLFPRCFLPPCSPLSIVLSVRRRLFYLLLRRLLLLRPPSVAGSLLLSLL